MKKYLHKDNSRSTDEKKVRDSGVELLRIIAAFMIMMHHAVQHGSENDYALIEGALSVNQFWSAFLGSWGQAGVAIFIIISSWFCQEKDYRFSTGHVIKIVAQTWFTCALIAAGVFLSGMVATDGVFWYELLTPFSLNGQYWFVDAYLIFYCLMPFLRRAVNTLSAGRLKLLCVVAIVCYVCICHLWVSNIVLNFMLLYIITGYLKRHPGNLIEKYRYVIAFVSFAAIVIILEVYAYRAALGNPADYVEKMRFYNDGYPVFLYTFAFSIFYIFKNSNMKYSGLINVISKTALGTYLISENGLMRGAFGRGLLWNYLINIEEFFWSDKYPLFLIASVSVVFVSCVIIELIRIYTVERLFFGTKGILKKTGVWIDTRIMEWVKKTDDALDIRKT